MARYVIFALSICFSLNGVVRCGCVEDLQKDPQANDCMRGYVTYLQQSAKNGVGILNIVGMLCSAEGQAAISCVYDFIARCPEMIESQGLGSIPPREQIKAMCKMPPGLGDLFDTKCRVAANCLTESGSNRDFPDWLEEPEEPETLFIYVQKLMQPICGVFSEMFACVTPDVETECPSVAEQVRNISALGQEKMQPHFPSFETLRMLTKERCPQLPNDFGTSRCVHDKLQEQSYVDCIKVVNKQFTTSSEKMSCVAVDQRLACLSDALVLKCGKEYYDGIVNNAQYFFTDEPLTCDRNLAAIVQVSLITFFMSCLILLILY
ncbi:hypothetical protein DPMN_135832 [Dreissena polymorpha]|uniref:Uncharacterized protein n=2 Tax=Dreissena polymorpha TaxID=45954 RepID=A0A9D4FYI0_DREPO|nr:hypothetical protein DPMN_135832 [Dreissena polymorpha]